MMLKAITGYSTAADSAAAGREAAAMIKKDLKAPNMFSFIPRKRRRDACS